MGNYLILNDVNSNTITGLLIQNLPPISKPRQRVNIEEIDGRDGDIITPLGYGAYDKEFQIGLSYNYDVDEIIKYFDSEGKVTFSNELDKYYNYKIIEQIDFEKLIRFKTATVKMHVQPFKYANNEESITDEFDPITAEGKSMSLNNTVPNTFNEFLIHGNSEQDGTPTPSNQVPINSAGDNINLFDKTANITRGYTYTSTGGTAQLNNCFVQEKYIKVESSKDYILSTTNSYISETDYRLIICEYDSSKNFIKRNLSSTQYYRITTSATTKYVRLCASTVTIDELKFEHGSIATPYSPYGMGSINEVISNKNLLENTYTTSGTQGGITHAKNTDGTMLLNGTSTTTVFMVLNTFNLLAGTYILSGCPNGGSENGYRQDILVGNNVIAKDFGSGGSFTLNETTSIQPRIRIGSGTAINNLTFKPMIRLASSSATSFVPHQEQNISIPCQQPMRSIGNVRVGFVKIDGVWYEKHNIGQVIFNGSENWNMTNDGSFKRFSTLISDLEQFTIRKSNLLSNYYIGSTTSGIGIIYSYDKYVYLYPTSDITSVDAFKTWLSTHNTEVIYQLAEPIYLECKEEQTQVLESKKHSYDGQTHISNLDATPAHMRVAVNGDTSLTVRNEGNIYSKPVFTISGSGDISMYLNNSQVFEISLGDEEYITIDIDKMEAYKGEILKNRLVKGNYENCVLETGDNTISFTGAVTGIEISNYSRWI